jgi:hypothetical protein
MKSFLWGLTVVLGIAGLFVPVLLVVAFVTAMMAIGAAPAGQRADGKDRTGGLLGGAWDSAVIAGTMKDCPHCLSKIPKAAAVCRHCQRDTPPVEVEQKEKPDPRDIYNRKG